MPVTAEASVKPGSIPNYAWGVLAVICLIGAGLRFYGLSIQSLYNDELSSWLRSSYPTLSEVIDKGVRPDVHPPGFQVLLYFVIQWIGSSPSILRLPAAIAGVLCIPAIFELGRRLYSWREGLIAASLLAASFNMVHYSQEARGYAFLLLFTMISTMFWLECLKRELSRAAVFWCVAGYAIFALASMYFHYFGILMVGMQALAALGFAASRKNWQRFAVAYLLILVGYLPWLRELYADLTGPPSWMPKPDPTAFWNFWVFWYEGSGYLAKAALAITSLGLLGLLIAIAFGRESIYTRTTFKVVIPGTILLLLWFVLPITIAYIKSVTSTPVLTMKNLIISAPPAYLLTARAIAWPRMLHSVAVAGLSLVLAGVLSWHLVHVGKYYETVQKEQFRESVQFVLQNERKFSQAPLLTSLNSVEYFNYYLKLYGSNRRVLRNVRTENEFSFLQDALSSFQSIWYAYANAKPDPRIVAYLAARMEEAKHGWGRGTEVFLFTRATSGTLAMGHLDDVPSLSYVVSGSAFTGTLNWQKWKLYIQVLRDFDTLRAPVELNKGATGVQIHLVGRNSGASLPVVDSFLEASDRETSIPLVTGATIDKVTRLFSTAAIPAGRYSLVLAYRSNTAGAGRAEPIEVHSFVFTP